jgi:hypothetical protein
VWFGQRWDAFRFGNVGCGRVMRNKVGGLARFDTVRSGLVCKDGVRLGMNRRGMKILLRK